MRVRRTTRRQLKLLPNEWDITEDSDIAVAHERITASERFGLQLQSQKIPAVKEWRFAKGLGRQWRFDWAVPTYMLAIEIEGLVMRRLAGQLVVMGRHASPAGIKDDMEKYNAAVLLGWYVLRFEQHDVKPRRAIDMTLNVLMARGWAAKE